MEVNLTLKLNSLKSRLNLPWPRLLNFSIILLLVVLRLLDILWLLVVVHHLLLLRLGHELLLRLHEVLLLDWLRLSVNTINILFAIIVVLLRDRLGVLRLLFHVKLLVAEATAATQGHHYTEHGGDYVCVILVGAVIT